MLNLIQSNVQVTFSIVILILVLICLGAEILPEVKAKMIVIPTLLLIVGWTSYNLYIYYLSKKSMIK